MNSSEICRALDEIPAEIAWRRSDSIVTDTPDLFQVITPSSKLIPLNGIYRSIFNSDRVTERIEQAIADFGKYSIPFRWVITGTSRPTDLANHLERFNFKKDHEALGLAATASQLLKLGTPKAQIMALDEAHIDEWVDAAVNGWGNPESFRQSLRTDVLTALRHEQGVLRYFSAFINGTLVGTGALRLCKKSAHLIGSSVRPEFRGRGVYQALVIKRAEMARNHGLELITTHGMVNTSAPILSKMGFQQFTKSIQYSKSVS